jgi:hypothetical protein
LGLGAVLVLRQVSFITGDDYTFKMGVLSCHSVLFTVMTNTVLESQDYMENSSVLTAGLLFKN